MMKLCGIIVVTLVNVSSTGDVTVDTAEIILGPPRGTDTIHKPLAGPFCVAVQ